MMFRTEREGGRREREREGEREIEREREREREREKERERERERGVRETESPNARDTTLYLYAEYPIYIGPAIYISCQCVEYPIIYRFPYINIGPPIYKS